MGATFEARFTALAHWRWLFLFSRDSWDDVMKIKNDVYGKLVGAIGQGFTHPDGKAVWNPVQTSIAGIPNVGGTAAFGLTGHINTVMPNDVTKDVYVTKDAYAPNVAYATKVTYTTPKVSETILERISFITNSLTNVKNYMNNKT